MHMEESFTIFSSTRTRRNQRKSASCRYKRKHSSAVELAVTGHGSCYMFTSSEETGLNPRIKIHHDLIRTKILPPADEVLEPHISG